VLHVYFLLIKHSILEGGGSFINQKAKEISKAHETQDIHKAACGVAKAIHKLRVRVGCSEVQLLAGWTGTLGRPFS
jgi:isopentenyl phosphate kinase